MKAIVMSPTGLAGVYAADDVAVLPNVIAAGHNLQKLTVAQVGVGYRLLAPEEIHKHRSYHTAIEMWDGRGWDATAWSGSTDTRTYRTTEPPGFFLPDPKTMTAEVREKIVEAVKAMIEATPKSTRYVHTFACDACVRRCTMETITLDPELTSLGMRCPFSDPPFISLWRKVDGVHALTP